MKLREYIFIIFSLILTHSAEAYERLPWESHDTYAEKRENEPIATPEKAPAFVGPFECPDLDKSTKEDEVVRDCLDKNGAGINHVYQAALQKNQNLSGSVELSVTTKSDGRVSHIEVIKSSLDSSFSDSLISYFMKMKFSSGVAGRTFKFSVNFERQ